MPDDEVLETSETPTSEPAAQATVETDVGGPDSPQPSEPQDWRSEKYGADWQNSVDYWKDHNKYLRGELDKAKAKQPRRQLEETQVEAKAEAKGDPYADIKDVPSLFSRVDQSIDSRLQNFQREADFRASMRAVRDKEVGDSKRGIPSFSDLEEEVLIPAIQQNPAILQLVKQAFPSNAGQALYTLGFLLKFPTLDALGKLFAGKAREELGDKIEEVSKEAVRVKGGREGATNSKLTANDIWGMSRENFAKLQAKNTGREP